MSDTWTTKHHPPKALPPHVETCDSRWDGGKCDCGADNRAPAGAQERCVGDFTIRTYVGARDRVEVIGNHSGVRYEAPVISRTTIAWVNAVLRCLHQLDAFKQPDAAPTVPHPQPDRAALVEHLRARIRIAEDAGVELARIRLDTLREIINAISVPIRTSPEATERPA